MLRINHTNYKGPIEITSYFGGVPIFRTQLALKLKKFLNSMVGRWCKGAVCAILVPPLSNSGNR